MQSPPLSGGTKALLVDKFLKGSAPSSCPPYLLVRCRTRVRWRRLLFFGHPLVRGWCCHVRGEAQGCRLEGGLSSTLLHKYLSVIVRRLYPHTVGVLCCVSGLAGMNSACRPSRPANACTPACPYLTVGLGFARASAVSRARHRSALFVVILMTSLEEGDFYSSGGWGPSLQATLPPTRTRPKPHM